jgi:hypothetical protein
MRQKGLTIAPEMKAEVEAELEELERIRWYLHSIRCESDQVKFIYLKNPSP